MGMLDFIKNRKAQQQTSAPTQQRETAKQMYSREAVQEKAAARPMDRLSADQMAKVDGIKADLQRATQEGGRNAPFTVPAQGDATANPQPMAQMSMNQDKAAAALSPTSAQAGARATEQNRSSSAAPSKQDRPQTIARRPPSWER